MKSDLSHKPVYSRIHSPPKNEAKGRPGSSAHFPSLSLPAYPRAYASSHQLKRVNLSFMSSPKSHSILNLTSINTAAGSRAPSPVDDQTMVRPDGPVSLLEAQLMEAKGRLRKGLALTMSTQAIRDSLVLKYQQELDLRKPTETSLTLTSKAVRFKAKKTLSLNYQSPRSPSSPSTHGIDSFLAAGHRMQIRRKQGTRRARTIRPAKLIPRRKAL